jgi:hypothetical protein
LSVCHIHNILVIQEFGKGSGEEPLISPLAEGLHTEGAGDRYAALVVRRAKAGGVPAAMDLLSDPVALVDAGHLRREADGYQIAYRTSGS